MQRRIASEMTCLIVSERGTIEYVTLLKCPAIWDAMADDLIDRGAAGLGEVVVVQWRRVAVACSAGLRTIKNTHKLNTQ